MNAKGYVVRGKRGSDGAAITAWTSGRGIGEPISAAVFGTPGLAAGASEGLLYRGCTDVAIFRIHPDGREERLPSYEDARGALSILRDEAQAAQNYKRGGMSCGGPPLLWTCPPSALKELLRLADGAPVVDVLAALEAAERRLLEEGGYQPEPNESAWWRSRSGVLTARDEAVSIVRHEFQIERRRLAAKGGA